MATDSKKIAKNTMMLYARMLLIMVVTLYTSRVILKVLGVEDYGIYNLIAGFVTFLVFITNSLVAAMQRYFNVSLGKRDIQRYREIFSMSLNILFLFSFLILIIGETIGLWFVRNYLNLPETRFSAAIWVYQISLLTFIANTLRTPFHASIIAHEKMSFYAYISIAEVIIRLLLVFLLMMIPYDSLIMYAVLYLGSIIIVDIIYIVYCIRKFEACQYTFKRDEKLFKELLGFSGWTLIGQSSVVIKGQGEAILINRFFSVVANAAMGVALQISNAIEMFVSNFQTAFNPQLTQTYASGDVNVHQQLLFRSAKFSYYLLLLMLLPVVFNIDYILNLWLEDVPEYTRFFVILILISYLFNAVSTPFYTSILASGKIKYYQISLGLIFAIGLLSIYLLLCIGFPPYSVSIVSIVIQIILLIVRVLFCKKYIKISIRKLLKEIILPITFCTITAIVILLVVNSLLRGCFPSMIVILLDVGVIVSLIFIIGLTDAEKSFILGMVNSVNRAWKK